MGIGLADSQLDHSARFGPAKPIAGEYRSTPASRRFAVATRIVAPLIAGIIPALLATQVNLRRRTSRRQVRPRRAEPPRLGIGLAVLQVSVASRWWRGLPVRGYICNYARLPLGFDPTGVTVFHVDPKRMGYDSHRQRAYYQRLTERVAALPGVTQVGLVDVPPFAGMFDISRILPPGAPAGTKPLEATEFHVSGAYFTTLRIKMHRGRPFTDADLWPELP